MELKTAFFREVTTSLKTQLVQMYNATIYYDKESRLYKERYTNNYTSNFKYEVHKYDFNRIHIDMPHFCHPNLSNNNIFNNIESHQVPTCLYNFTGVYPGCYFTHN